MPKINKRNWDNCGKYYKKQNRQFCSRVCRPQPEKFLKSIRFGGKKHSLKTLKKKSLVQLGENGSNWKGGINPINRGIRKRLEYRLWRESVFERDNWTCQKYGTRGGKLHPHHIKNFAQFPELRFAIDNGITFSEKAHREFHKKYGKINNTREQLKDFLK